MWNNETKRFTGNCEFCDTGLKILRTAQHGLAQAYCPKCKEYLFNVAVGKDYKFYDDIKD